MEPFSSTIESPLTAAEGQSLLDVARISIVSGIEEGRPFLPDLMKYPPTLQEKRATFVTLHCDSELRGCIGVIEARRPLIADVAENAYAAAFHDPRFLPIVMEELSGLEISVSILSSMEPLVFDSEEELIAQFRVGVDGLVLKDGWHCGTFLPAVWEMLPDPLDFLKQLKKKAGLPENHRSRSMRFERFTVQSVS